MKLPLSITRLSETMSVGRFSLILGLLLAVFAVGWFAGAQNPNLLSDEANEAPINEPEEITRVVAQGRIVPANGIHNVITAPGQRIESVLVKENDKVVAGDTRLATLEGEKVLDLQTDLVDARAEEASTELDQKILLAENNVASAGGAVESAKLQLNEAQKGVDLTVTEKQIASANRKLNRLLGLQSDPDTQMYISQGEVADQQLSIDQAQSQIDAAKRKQQSAIAASELALSVSQQSRTSATRALESLKKLRKQERSVKLSKQIAEDRRDAARIVSPTGGTVLKVFAKQGDVVGNTPLMQIGDLTEMQCVAEVVDRLVGEVKIGQAATITSPALDKPIQGTVISIGRFVGQSTLQQPNPLALVDRKTVDVRIQIVDSDIDVASRLVNLQVTVEIATKEN